MATIWIPDGYDPNKPSTNADRIRAMSDEELAMFLAGNGLCPDGYVWLDWLKNHAEVEECQS